MMPIEPLGCVPSRVADREPLALTFVVALMVPIRSPIANIGEGDGVGPGVNPE